MAENLHSKLLTRVQEYIKARGIKADPAVLIAKLLDNGSTAAVLDLIPDQTLARDLDGVREVSKEQAKTEAKQSIEDQAKAKVQSLGIKDPTSRLQAYRRIVSELSGTASPKHSVPPPGADPRVWGFHLDRGRRAQGSLRALNERVRQKPELAAGLKHEMDRLAGLIREARLEVPE